MESLKSVIIGIIVLVTAIGGVTSLLAQGVSASASANAGLAVAYNVHLAVAQRWVAALNASGINSTAVINLINKAEAYAAAGNYLEAIATLNAAINLAAKLMASAHVNSTQAILSNYASLSSAVNSTVVSELINNETIANLTLRVLAASSTSDNASAMVGMGAAILSSEEASLGPYVSASALAGLNTAINVLNAARNELVSAGLNSTARQLAILKAELVTTSLLLPTSARAHVIAKIVMPYMASLGSNVSSTINQLSLLLNTTIPTPQQMAQCMNELNGTILSLINASLSGPSAYVEAGEFVNEYATCLGLVKVLVHEAATAHAVVAGFTNVTSTLNSAGLSNLTPYVLSAYSQCRAELINAFSTGNTTLIGQVISQCRARAGGYWNETKYAVWAVNLARKYLSYANYTIWGLARKHGISGAVPMLCYVRLNSTVLANITSILRAMINGSITPLEAQALINEYLNSIIGLTPSLAAGCLGIGTPPHTYIPMATKPSASGELSISSNGSAELVIEVVNPTQGSIYISGFGIGGLRCTFSSAIEVQANSQATIELGLTTSNQVVTGVSSLSVSGGAEVSQGTTVNCVGSLAIMPMQPMISGELYLSNGEWVALSVMVNAGTNVFIGW